MGPFQFNQDASQTPRQLMEQAARAQQSGVKKKKIRKALNPRGKQVDLEGNIRGSDMTDRVVGNVTNAVGIGKQGTKVKNDLLPGENHAVLIMKDGSKERGAYIGPGTQLVKRLERGIRGKTPVDKVAKQHDIAYGLAKSPADVAKADQIMLKSVAGIRAGKLDHPFNIAQANLMKPKVAVEKILGANRLKFADLKGPGGGNAGILRRNQKAAGLWA